MHSGDFSKVVSFVGHLIAGIGNIVTRLENNNSNSNLQKPYLEYKILVPSENEAQYKITLESLEHLLHFKGFS